MLRPFISTMVPFPSTSLKRRLVSCWPPTFHIDYGAVPIHEPEAQVRELLAAHINELTGVK